MTMLTLLSALTSTALADQCAWNDEAHARGALPYLPSGATWLSYCEPCGDDVPVVGTVGQASVAPVSDGRFHEVSIDGRGVDLAYVFVKARPDDAQYTNLAKLVGCPASMVSRKVTWPLSTQQSDRLSSWLGTYTRPTTRLVIQQFFDDPNGLALQLDHPTEHDSGAGTMELHGYVDIDGDPLTMATSLGDCALQLSKADGGVRLTPTAACGGLLDAVAGTYTKQ